MPPFLGRRAHALGTPHKHCAHGCARLTERVLEARAAPPARPADLDLRLGLVVVGIAQLARGARPVYGIDEGARYAHRAHEVGSWTLPSRSRSCSRRGDHFEQSVCCRWRRSSSGADPDAIIDVAHGRSRLDRDHPPARARGNRTLYCSWHRSAAGADRRPAGRLGGACARRGVSNRDFSPGQTTGARHNTFITFITIDHRGENSQTFRHRPRNGRDSAGRRRHRPGPTSRSIRTATKGTDASVGRASSRTRRTPRPRQGHGPVPDRSPDRRGARRTDSRVDGRAPHTDGQDPDPDRRRTGHERSQGRDLTADGKASPSRNFQEFRISVGCPATRLHLVPDDPDLQRRLDRPVGGDVSARRT